MSANRGDVVQELFAAALERVPEQRTSFLDATAEDAEVRAEVLSLLLAHERRGRLDSILGRLHALRRDAPSLTAAELMNRLRTALGDRYRVERELGRGGMAIIFLAEDLKHRRKVALKILKPELAHDVGTARFLQEIAIAARLAHPHILPLHDSGEADGFLYYVMPYVEGESLRDRLEREQRLAVQDALRIAREVADALSYAHSHDVIHRDIKPENILLAAGHAVVSDFGIARAMKAAGGDELTEAAIALGTPAYMSPEQAGGDPSLDGRSDVYSLGCVLYEMLVGEPPFRGTIVANVLDQHLGKDPPEIRAAPAAVASAIQRALAKAPAERFPSAAQFENALAVVTAQVSHVATRGRWRSRYVVVPVVLAAGLITAVVRARRQAPVHPAASVLAVLPLTATSGDSSLARLGRDLVVTLSANLDGVSEIRTIDALTVLAQTRESRAVPLDEGSRLAGRLGASGVMHGSIARGGSEISIDAGIFAVDGGNAIARISWTGNPDDLTAITDTLTWKLLREVWRARAPPTPNLAALTTRSLPALRAFLEGERAGLESRWEAAAQAYARAMSADSTFWLAYWRYAFARWWYLEAVDDDIVRALQTHRYSLPPRDRLVFESWVSDTFSVALARSREVVTRYPDYWPGWMQHADWLFHVGPVYGYDRAEGKAALQRTVELNPALIPAWEHLFWAAMPDDTVIAARAVAALAGLGFAQTSTAEFGFDIGRVYRFELALRRSGVADRPLQDSIVVDLVTAARGRLGSGATFAPAQIALSERVLRARPRRELATIHEAALANAWASRGAWDTAVTFAEQYARRPTGSDALTAYRLAVIGAWLGALPPERAQRQRILPAHVTERPGSAAMVRAEFAWLDGLLAITRRDRNALVGARERLRRIDTVSTPLLDRTLGAFEAELAGERGLAARILAATNWKNPDLLVPGYAAHPYVIAISRLAAARWLVAEGDTKEAIRLLMWFEAAWALDGYRPARRVLGSLAALERARLAEAAQQFDLARRAYTEFLDRYDTPVPAHRHLVEEAHTALMRLPPESDRVIGS